jgi:hypothetical protein
MFIDTVWSFYAMPRGGPFHVWIFWNIALSIAFIAILYAPGKWTKPYGPACIGAAICIFITVVTYYQLWDFYFPSHK